MLRENTQISESRKDKIRKNSTGFNFAIENLGFTVTKDGAEDCLFIKTLLMYEVLCLDHQVPDFNYFCKESSQSVNV